MGGAHTPKWDPIWFWPTAKSKGNDEVRTDAFWALGGSKNETSKLPGREKEAAL